MTIKVKKRDGSIVDYDVGKIKSAISRAGKLDSLDDVVSAINEDIHNKIRIQGWEEISVDDIQNIVENHLMVTNQDIARAYITYRYLHDVTRDKYNDLMAMVEKRLLATDVQNQNANVDERSFGGRVGEMSDAVAKQYALEYIMSPMSRRNHENNEIYIHDLSAYAVGMSNCLTLPIDDLLKNGFKTRQTDVRPAQSVNTAMQLVAVLMQLQSLTMFGGVAVSHLDYSMIPYVRKSFYKHYKDGMKYIKHQDYSLDNIEDISIEDEIYKKDSEVYQYAKDMTVKEVYQAVEGLYHNLNTLQSRSGCQLPFSSINYGTCTSEEGRLVIRALLEVSIEGIGKLHKTSVFPCGIFKLKKGVNRYPGDPNYDLFRLALKSTAQRLYPNYVNVSWSVNAGYDENDPRQEVATMGKWYNVAHIKLFEL